MKTVSPAAIMNDRASLFPDGVLPEGEKLTLCCFYDTVIVAVIAVGVMQVAPDEIVRMLSMRNNLMSTARAVGVALVVLPTAVRRRALLWIGGIYSDAALVDMIAVSVMQMAIVQVIAVIAVLDGLMSTA